LYLLAGLEACTRLRRRVVDWEIALDAELFERHVLRRIEDGERGEERELQIVAPETQGERRITGNGEVGLTPTFRHVWILEQRPQERSDVGVLRPGERLTVQARREEVRDALPVDYEWSHEARVEQHGKDVRSGRQRARVDHQSRKNARRSLV